MRPIGSAVAVLVVVLVLGRAEAGADTVILQYGGLLSGALDVSELVVATPGGEMRVGTGEIQTITLAGVDGDVVTLRTGRTITGRIEHPTYAMRLPSGQTVVFARGGVDQLHFAPRP